MRFWIGLPLAVWLAVGTGVSAGEKPASATTPAKLKWQARGVPRAVDSTIAPAGATPAAGEVRQAVVRQSAAQFSTRASRSKLRDAIMQVSSQTADARKDPFGDDTAVIEHPTAAPADAPDEANPSEDSADPFPDNPVPGAPAPRSSLYDTAPAPPAVDETIPQILAEPGKGCAGDKADCERALAFVRRRGIDKIEVGVIIKGVEGNDYPCQCPLPKDRYLERNFSPTTFTWKATGVCHKPLYFEDVQLERYGHSWNPVLQPFMSAGHFFVSVPLLPYKMGLNPPGECIYTLGYYRPGNCAPYVIEPIPWSLRGALFQAGAGTGFAFWFWP